jgi:uncharacterized glyoxalase superfamily protein PhnB
MRANITEPGGTVVPTLRYRDAAAAIDWLCNAFGFEKNLVVNGDDGAVRYAELTFGNGMIMLGPVEDSGLDKFMTQPADTGGAETQICYLFVADAAAHCARAKAADAEIVLDIDDADSNGRGYSCRDLEGHVWHFGTYDPWKRQPAPAAGSSRRSSGLRGGPRRLALAAGLVVVAIASAVLVGWALGVTEVSFLELGSAASTSAAEAAVSTQHDQLARERDALKDAKEQLARERGERASVERLARSTREQLGQERTARETAERVAREAQAQLVREQSTRENAERAIKHAGDPLARADTERALEDVRQQLARERSALEDAQRVTQEARERLNLAERAGEAVQEQLAAERSAREVAELAAQQVREQLAKEHGAKEASERAAKEAREQEAKERAARKPPPRPRPTQSSQSSDKPIVNWYQ